MYLGIDTSSSHLCLGLWSKNGLADKLELFVERDHAKRLIVELAGFLAQHGLHKQDLLGIGVGLGPGSYTGIRVGIASAKGLARGLSLPLRGASSLEAMAASCVKKGEQAIVALDARKEHIYYGKFLHQDDSIKLQGDLAKGARADIKSHFSTLAYYENSLPDAAYLAKQAALLGTSELSAIYL